MTYRKIEHDQVKDIFTNAFNSKNIEYSCDEYNMGQTKRGFKFIINNIKLDLHGDKVSPMIIVLNSLNKESSLNFKGGLFRFACCNGMTIGKEMFVGKIIHRKGETFEQKIKDLEYQIAAFLDKIQELYARVERETAQELSTNQMVRIVESLKITKKAKALAKTKIIFPQTRREEDMYNNIWILWNIVNEAIRETSKKESARERHNNNLLRDCIRYANAA